MLDVSTLTADRYIAHGERVFGVYRIRDLGSGEDILMAEESVVRDGKVVEITVYFHDVRSMLSRARLPGC